MVAFQYGWKMYWDISQMAIGMLLSPNINLSTLAGACMGMGILQPLIKSIHLCDAELRGTGDRAC